MTKTRSTKNALISAILVLCMCFTGLLGTTFAWFTDSVTSSGNKIVAGTLKVDLELLDKATGEWKSLKKDNDPIFVSEKWEPGHTEVKILKVENEGNLALSWKTVLTKYSEISELADVIDVYVLAYGVLDDASTVTYPQDRDLTGYTRVGTAAEFLRTMKATTKGFLEAEQSAYLGLALKMREDADNKYQGMSLGGTFDITVYATQGSFEEDSFDNFYDGGATFPLAPGEISKVGSAVTADANNQVAAPVAYNNDFVKTEIPTGALLEDGATSVETVISYTERTADVQVTAGQVSRTIDLHVNGLSENNTVPVKHTLNEFFPKNYSRSNVSIYHVDNGVTVNMTHVESLAELDAHNEMYYDPATGDVVLSMATHSEIVAVTNVGNPWEGGIDTTWYDTTSTSFEIKTAAEFAGFAAIVGGMAPDIARDSFKDKTVTLKADINLGSANGKIFTPVGYYFTKDHNGDGTESNTKEDVFSDLYAFSGTFDGQGHTISNVYQSTWEIKGDNKYYDITQNQYYNDGMGIFGWVHGGTVKNLAVHNFSSDGEFTTTGCVAAYSSGTSTFENIRVSNSNPRAYNVPNGGVVGYAYSGNDPESPDHIKFTNVTVDTTTKITALWGSWDVGCGGILGRVSDTAKVTMKDCIVGAVIDVYSDVCGNYQYYQFRYAGMLIGTVGSDEDTTDQKDNLTFENVAVYYGDWANDLHYYCELVENSLASYTHDHQMSRLTKIGSVGEIQGTDGKWNKTGNYVVVAADGTATCYHIRKNANGELYQHNHKDYNNDGTEDKQTVDGVEVYVEDKQCVHIPFNQLYSGYGWGAQHVSDGVDAKEVKYTITYINNSEVLDVKYVTDNSVAQSTTNSVAETAAVESMKALGPEYEDVVFDHWMNAGSTPVSAVDKDNDKDVILYPSFANVFTATFVDQDANVLGWTTFTVNDVTGAIDYTKVSGTAESLKSSVPRIDNCIFEKWQVRVVNDNGSYQYVDLDFNNFKYKTDITISPIYQIDPASGSAVRLKGVDTDGDGAYNYYEVVGYGNGTGQTTVEIPSNLNGIPVKIVNEDAFSAYDDLHSVRIPGTITRLNEESFTASNNGTGRDTVTLYYEGDTKTWNEAMDAYNKRGSDYDVNQDAMLGSGWDNNMGEGSCVFFLDENGKVDLSKGYWELAQTGGFIGIGSKFVWQYHNHEYGSNSGCGNEHNNSTVYTDPCVCTTKTTGDTAHIYVDANGNVMEHNDAGTPVNSSGDVIYFQDGGWFGEDKLTDGTNTYYRYRPDAKYWEGVTAN